MSSRCFWSFSALLLSITAGCSDSSGGPANGGGSSDASDASTDGNSGSGGTDGSDAGAENGGENSGGEGSGGSGGEGGGASGGSGGAGGGVVLPSDALPLVDLPDYSTADSEAFLDGVVGTYEVAIYRVPEGNEDWIGLAMLTIERSGDGFAAELVAENGATVSSVDSNMSLNALLTPVIGQVFVFEDSSVEGYLNISINAEGFINGAAGGFGEVAFRNNITSFGPGLPTVFENLAGTYQGVSQALTCGQPPVTLTIEAEGTATIEGQFNLACMDASATATWDGNDDYIVPTESGYSLALDSQKGGGSLEGGSITVSFPSLEPGSIVTHVLSPGSGAVGNIESNSLIKEGVSPTQAQFGVRLIRGQTLEVQASGTDMPPWDMDTSTVTINEDDTVSFSGQTLAFNIAQDVPDTTDEKTFSFQAIYETFNIIYVNLTFKTDGTFLGGTYGGGSTGEGTLTPN